MPPIPKRGDRVRTAVALASDARGLHQDNRIGRRPDADGVVMHPHVESAGTFVLVHHGPPYPDAFYHPDEITVQP